MPSLETATPRSREKGDTADRTEPLVSTAVVASRDLDQERDDDRRDDHEPGDRSCDYVDLAKPLVATVSAQATDRLAPSAEQDQGPEHDHHSEREEPAARVAPDPHRGQHGEPESDRDSDRNHLDLLICIEQFLHQDAEEAAERKCERQ